MENLKEQSQDKFSYGMVYYPTTDSSIKFNYTGVEITNHEDMHNKLQFLRGLDSGFIGGNHKYIVGTITKTSEKGYSARIFEQVVYVGDKPQLEWWEHCVAHILKADYDNMTEGARSLYLEASGARKFIGDI
jgi:hypothetical protein